MTKLRNLFRLIFRNRLKIILYYFKRIIKINNTISFKSLNDYFHTLIRINAVQNKETQKFYITRFKENKLELKTRKRPSSDIDVLNQVFANKEYEAVYNTYIKHFITDGINIIDAGANVGYTSLYFSTKFGDLNLISIEPEPENFDLLKENLSINNISAQVLKAGLWSKTTHLKIVNDFRDKKEWSFRVEETNDTNGIYAVTVNKLLESNNWKYIDILKIDIEGAEKEIFMANQSNLDFLSKTKVIAIEIHDEFNCRDSIYTVLNKNGFEYFNSGELTIGVNTNLIDKNS